MSQKFLTEEQISTIEKAIADAELKCSGEVRVHIDRTCSANVLDDAAHTFAKLGMHKTKLRNGVLFYVAYEDRKFAVIGDMGINNKVPDGYWDDVCAVLEECFRNGDFVGGLVKGVTMCGEKLAEFFPRPDDDVNELPDQISFGK
ncbi:MAG: TPM domain-containing protein [Bacteroidales bacterium]|nr:TPM domain-containing protein [Bacteroidales bacterium]